jgi:hypothetical protein
MRLILIPILIMGLLSTMSGIGILLGALYIIMILALNFFVKPTSIWSKLVILLIVGTLVLVVLGFSEFFRNLQDLVLAKLDGDNVSHSDRLDRFNALRKLEGLSWLIGFGPAAFSTLNVPSFISLYLGILMNTGVLGALMWVLFCHRKFRSVIGIKDLDLKFALFSSLLFACFHLAFIDIIYVPWFWVLMAMIDVVKAKQHVGSVAYES